MTKPTSQANRIMRRVSMCQNTGCWIWMGYLKHDYYSNLFVGGGGKRKYRGTHCVSYEVFRGPIPAGYTIDHLCRNPWCVNPAHLEPVPYRVNWARGNSASRRNALKTHCKRGHPFSEENTHRRAGTGARECLTCKAEKRSEAAMEQTPQLVAP